MESQTNNIPLEKDESYRIINMKLNNFNFQTLQDFNYNNGINLHTKSKNDVSLYSNITNIKDGECTQLSVSSKLDQSNSLLNHNILLSKKKTFLNKKRKKDKNESIKINFWNISHQNFYKGKKKGLFKVDKNKIGRKKKGSGEIGKHDKYSRDNLRSKVKTYSLKFLLDYFNKEIQKIDIQDLNKSFIRRLYQMKTVDDKTKAYNLKLLDESFKSIFSSPVSGKADKNENHNKDLIENIYKINQEGNLEKTKKIIKIFNMKYREFFNYVKIIKDNPNLKEKIGQIDDDIIEMIKKFDFYLEEKLNKDSKDKDYNQKLIELIKNFPSDISNMQEKKK